MTTLPGYHILVVDDDERLRSLLKQYLSDQGWIVTVARNAGDARKKMAMFIFDLIVLDVMMPGEKGTDFAASLRPGNRTPILMLTAMGDTQDRIEGLESGADDYLGKPFEPRELSLRIQKLLERSYQNAPVNDTVQFGFYAFDTNRSTLTYQGKPVYLTTGEIQLLSELARQPGTAVSRVELAKLLGVEASNERSVDVQVNRLRKKIEPDTSHPVYIQTIRGEGYVLRCS